MLALHKPLMESWMASRLVWLAAVWLGVAGLLYKPRMDFCISSRSSTSMPILSCTQEAGKRKAARHGGCLDVTLHYRRRKTGMEQQTLGGVYRCIDM